MAHTLQAKLKEPEADENKRGPKPQDLIRLYDIILQVNVWTSDVLYVVKSVVSHSSWQQHCLFCSVTGKGMCTLLCLTVCHSQCNSQSPSCSSFLVLVHLFRVWLSCPPCRGWRMTTPSRRRCPSRPWSTRPTGQKHVVSTFSPAKT